MIRRANAVVMLAALCLTRAPSRNGPPDLVVPVFPKSDLEAGGDGAIEKALELLVQRPPR